MSIELQPAAGSWIGGGPQCPTLDRQANGPGPAGQGVLKNTLARFRPGLRATAAGIRIRRTAKHASSSVVEAAACRLGFMGEERRKPLMKRCRSRGSTATVGHRGRVGYFELGGGRGLSPGVSPTAARARVSRLV